MAKLNKINVEDIKTKAEKKDIYLYNDFLASTGYIDIKPDDIQRLQKWDLNEVFVEDTTSLDIEVSADFDKFLREYKVFKKIYLNIVKKVLV